MLSRSQLLLPLLAAMPTSTRRNFAKLYAPALTAELTDLTNARAYWTHIDDERLPLLQLTDATKLVGDMPTRFEEMLIGPFLKPLNITSTHAKVAIDYVVRYKHPHMAIAFDQISYPLKARTLFHRQHRSLLQECAFIDSHTKRVAGTLFTPQPAWRVLDVGCYLGYGSLWMSRLLHEGRIISVEAIRRNYSVAAANKAFNGAKNWEVLHGAIWHTAGTTVTISCASRQQNAIDPAVARGAKTTQVKTVSIASLSEQCDHAVDLVSLTVNGAELEAIQGMQTMNRNHLPHRILTPAWYPLNGVSRVHIIKPLLLQLGYKAVVSPGGFIFAWLPHLEPYAP
jgi:FkbM family methyltransferase